MLLLGYFLGTTFEGVVTNIDHWIAFILLSIIGIKMVKESFSKETKNYNDDVSVKTMLMKNCVLLSYNHKYIAR